MKKADYIFSFDTDNIIYQIIMGSYECFKYRGPPFTLENRPCCYCGVAWSDVKSIYRSIPSYSAKDFIEKIGLQRLSDGKITYVWVCKLRSRKALWCGVPCFEALKMMIDTQDELLPSFMTDQEEIRSHKFAIIIL